MNKLQLMSNAQMIAREAKTRDGHLTENEGRTLAKAFLALLKEADAMTVTIAELRKALDEETTHG